MPYITIIIYFCYYRGSKCLQLLTIMKLLRVDWKKSQRLRLGLNPRPKTRMQSYALIFMPFTEK